MPGGGGKSQFSHRHWFVSASPFFFVLNLFGYQFPLYVLWFHLWSTFLSASWFLGRSYCGVEKGGGGSKNQNHHQNCEEQLPGKEGNVLNCHFFQSTASFRFSGITDEVQHTLDALAQEEVETERRIQTRGAFGPSLAGVTVQLLFSSAGAFGRLCLWWWQKIVWPKRWLFCCPPNQPNMCAVFQASVGVYFGPRFSSPWTQDLLWFRCSSVGWWPFLMPPGDEHNYCSFISLDSSPHPTNIFQSVRKSVCEFSFLI